MPKIGLSKAAYARRRESLGFKGCSRQAVHAADSKGWLVLHEDGSIDPVASDRRWAAHTRGRVDDGAERPSDEARTAEADYNRERAENERIKRERGELALARERGELVSAAEVRAALTETDHALREALEGIPESVADRYAAEASAHAIREDLAATIKAALTAAADAIARGPLG